MYLTAGVTTMRTAGSISPELDLAVKHKIDEGTASAGPEMFLFESELGGRQKADSARAARAMTWKAWRASRERIAAVPASRVDNLLWKEQHFELDFVRMGGTLLAGCDPTGDGSNLAGFGDQREVELLVDAGFTPVEAIKIATKNGAEFLGVADRVGTILIGKQADVIVVDGDPSRNISDN